MFCDSCDAIEELVDVISDYISFCEDIVVHQKLLKYTPTTNLGLAKKSSKNG